MELPDDWGCGEYHSDVRKRIAELEAELADAQNQALVMTRYALDKKERAEKAEAEVERLRKEHLGMSDDDLRALREKGAV